MDAERAKANGRAAMRSPINWALLGLLIRRPSHGYELMHRFERTFPGTLELSSRSQIYTALDTLTRRGLIEHAQEAPGHDLVRQPKLQYRATRAGVQAYEQWLVEQVGEDPRHSRMLAQHVAALGPEKALRVLERCAEICLQTLGWPAEEAEDSAALAERLAGEERRLRASAILAWIEYARSELRALAEKKR